MDDVERELGDLIHRAAEVQATTLELTEFVRSRALARSLHLTDPDWVMVGLVFERERHELARGA